MVDSSYDNRDFQIEVTDKVIDQLGAGSKRKLMAYNKIDIAEELPLDVSGHDAVYISAKTGENMELLLSSVRFDRNDYEKYKSFTKDGEK